MPYVPSRKINAEDREILDPVIEEVAEYVASRITTNLSLIWVYRSVFIRLARSLRDCVMGMGGCLTTQPQVRELARAIYRVSEKYDYEGAHLGELNYAITRLIQRVPRLKVESSDWDQELRYWIYACTVDALVWASCRTHSFGVGASGVFEDVKDEYKRRVNIAYEAAQIIKSGDCYVTPYYTRLIKVIDERTGEVIGHQEVMLKRGVDTVGCDVLDWQIIARRVVKDKEDTEGHE